MKSDPDDRAKLAGLGLAQKGKRMAKPNKKAPLGQGGRFAAVAKAAGGGEKGAAIAAAAGRKKYGNAKMAKMAAAGKKKAK